MDYATVLSELNDEGVRTITLNRPDSLNAMNDALVRDVSRAFRDASGDAATNVIILTGAGRAFCAAPTALEMCYLDGLILGHRSLQSLHHYQSSCRRCGRNGVASASGRHHALPQCTHRKNTSSPVRRARFRVCVWQSGQGAVTMGTSLRRSGFGMRSIGSHRERGRQSTVRRCGSDRKRCRVPVSDASTRQTSGGCTRPLGRRLGVE